MIEKQDSSCFVITSILTFCDNVKFDFQKKDNICAALIDYFLYDKELPDTMKSFKKEIDNLYYNLDENILCRIMTDNNNNRNQTSIVPVLPQILEKPAFGFFHSEVGGHLGIDKTFHKLKQYFFVTSALTKLKNYVTPCVTCNLRKNPQIYPNPAIGRMPTARFLFDIVSFDLYGTSGE